MNRYVVYGSLFFMTIFTFTVCNAQAVMNEIYSRGTVGDPDWIELYNGSEAPIDLSGYKIYDIAGKNGTKPKKEIPAGTILPAYGFYIVLTEDGTTDASNFGLSSTGEWAWLENPAGQVIDSVAFSAMTEAQTYGRLPDGSANWQLLNYRSKGAPNSNQQPISVVMNEIFSEGTGSATDWIEVYNKVSTPTDISGFLIYAGGGKAGTTPKKVLPSGSIVPANGFLVIPTEGSGNPSDFNLSASGEWVWFENASGAVIDSVAFPAMNSTQSFSRMLDGAPSWRITGTITRGSSNNTHSIIPIALIVSGQLPAVLYESSGLATTVQGELWSHNDAGHVNVLYCVNTAGQLLRTITISNALNVDWEDLAVDNKKRIYVEDAGNNFNNRTDLTIYRIPDPESFTEDTVGADIIRFSFEDQTEFPPAAPNANFDVEAMVWYSDSLYLFTKDRSSPLTGYTKLYALPADTGTHVAGLRGSYYTGYTISSALVTSADLHRETGTLALLVKERLIVFKNYPQTRFFDGEVTEYPFVSIPGQVEAITFSSASTLVMTEEGTTTIPGNIYGISLTPTEVLPGNNAAPVGYLIEQNFPNPFNPATTIRYHLPQRSRVTLAVYNTLGQQIARLVDGEEPAGYRSVTWTANAASGVYFYRLEAVSVNDPTKRFVDVKVMMLLK
jgi:hypothetical protein